MKSEVRVAIEFLQYRHIFLLFQRFGKRSRYFCWHNVKINRSEPPQKNITLVDGLLIAVLRRYLILDKCIHTGYQLQVVMVITNEILS